MYVNIGMIHKIDAVEEIVGKRRFCLCHAIDQHGAIEEALELNPERRGSYGRTDESKEASRVL